jgi:hypothetical protein
MAANTGALREYTETDETILQRRDEGLSRPRSSLLLSNARKWGR